MLSTSRITVWLGLVLASLTSLLPVGGLTVCFGHEVQHHEHTHNHGLVVAVGTNHQSCVCHGPFSEQSTEKAPDECNQCPEDTHRCHGFAVDPPFVASAEDPAYRECHDCLRRIVGHVTWVSQVVGDSPSAARCVAWLPPPVEWPRVIPWLERSTVLIL